MLEAQSSLREGREGVGSREGMQERREREEGKKGGRKRENEGKRNQVV